MRNKESNPKMTLDKLAVMVANGFEELRGKIKIVDNKVDFVVERVDVLEKKADFVTERVDAVENKVEKISDNLDEVANRLENVESTLNRENKHIKKRVEKLENIVLTKN